MVAELLLHPRAVFESNTTIGEVLGVQERTEKNIPSSSKLPTDELRFPLSEQARED